MSQVDIPALCQRFCSLTANDNDILSVTTELRRISSVQENPPIKELLECGVIEKVVELMKHDEYQAGSGFFPV